MDFLCTYITPDGYIRLLRMLPMLSTLEIGFDLIGEESIRRTAGNFNSLQDKIRIQGIPERVRTLFLAYLKWAWYVFQELVDAAYRTAYFWDRSSVIDLCELSSSRFHKSFQDAYGHPH